jgi:peptidoglycan/xylan/chitin deacetylase (PgdA/CDA1 family)
LPLRKIDKVWNTVKLKRRNRRRKMLKVILSHDVDWSPTSPGLQHVLARRERFDEHLIAKAVNEGLNLYANIPEVMDLERHQNVRSTFFFRPKFDDGSLVDSYAHTIKDLVQGGWEIGVHLNDASSIKAVVVEKAAVEEVSGETVGCRVHYLKVADLSFMEKAGFQYDSSVMFSRDTIDEKNMDHFTVGRLVVFPITIMETYLFSYMHVTEDKVVEVVNKAVGLAAGKQFMTIVWHDCSLKMRGGRMFPRVLESLASREDIQLVRGIDACNIVKENEKVERKS